MFKKQSKKDSSGSPKKHFHRKNGKKPRDLKENAKTQTGIIRTNRKKTGYVDRDGDLPSIYFPEGNLLTAFDGDEISYELTGKKDRKNDLPVGRVRQVISKLKKRIVGTIVFENGSFFVKPDDPKIYQNILLNDQNLEIGQKAFVEFDWKKYSEGPRGKIIELLGKAKDNNAEMRSIALEKGFDTSFSPIVEAEAEMKRKTGSKISKEEFETRKDFRETLTFTIDPIDAKDFDDAISFIELGNGNFEIGVHIADVSHFVKPRTELDKEAQKRQFSVYLVDRTIPMLPEALSNDLCSLNPNEEKRAFSAVFEMDKRGKIHKEWFGKTVIKSHKRFSYEEAQSTIEDNSRHFHKELSVLNNIAKELRIQKEKDGAIDFEAPEVKFVLDENGKPISVIKKERKDAHKMIEEYMLLANRQVAKFISNKIKKEHKDKAFLYRVHDAPKSERISDLSIFLKALGYELEAKDGIVSNIQIQKLMKQISGTPEELLIKTAVLRSMSKAVYTTKNVGHFGLGFEFYTHFTSPIRRYPDLLVHRLLEETLANGHIRERDFDFLKRIGEMATEKEISAAEAERASIKYKQVEYMQNFVGKTFNATISGVTEWGIFVEETETRSEGMIRMKDLGEDYFELDEKSYCVVGRKTKKKYRLGDKVSVKLVNADLDNRTLDFSL